MARDESFLQRWSRRKAAPPADEAVEPEPAAETAAPDNPPPVAAREAEDTPAVDLDTLPDIESLDANADFSAFMQDGVPDALRTRALQKLWRLDPSFGHIDGLLEYADDFTDSAVAAEPLRTIYRVGKGMLRDADEEAAEKAAEIAGATPDAEPLPAPDDRNALPQAAPETPAEPQTAPRRDDPDRTG